MTLLELSVCYHDSAASLRERIAQLRREEQALADAEAIRGLERRIGELMPLLREMRELEKLTAHYYERGYHRNEKYTL